MVDTPTLDRIVELQPKSQFIGEFLEWIGDEGYVLCTYTDNGWSGRYNPIHKTINDLLHEFFEIDPVKEEREKLAMMEELRSFNG